MSMKSNLESIAIKSRLFYEEDLEGDWSQLDLTCATMSKHLCKALKDAGFDALRVMGRYYGADDDFEPDMSCWSEDDIDNYDFSDGFFHWWVECGDYIIDTCVDQFHPSDRESYRYIVVEKNSFEAVNYK